jgi:GTP-binding protein
LYTTDMSRFPDARFLISAAAAAQFPPDLGAEVAFVGRSNSGKSSAINAISQRHSLARTSRTPGRTRLLNFFELAPQQRIVDLPGYGFASGPQSDQRTWQRLIDELRRRQSLCGLFLIVDSRRGLLEGDQALLDWAPTGCPVHVLLSKADKLTRHQGASVLAQVRGDLAGRARVQLFSATTRAGVEEAQGVLAGWLIKNPGDLDQITGAY